MDFLLTFYILRRTISSNLHHYRDDSLSGTAIRLPAREHQQISGGIVVNELERIRDRLHTAISVGLPREEILKVSQHLDQLILISMKADRDRRQISLHGSSL